MTTKSLASLVARCKQVFPDMPVLGNFGLKAGNPFWSQKEAIPEGIDIVGFDDYVGGTPAEAKARAMSNIAYMKRVSKRKPVLVYGRTIVGDKELKRPLTEAQARAYKEAVVEAGAAGLLWAFYDETGWRSFNGASNFPDTLSVHRKIAEELRVRKLVW